MNDFEAERRSLALPATDEQRALGMRVAASVHFQKSPRLRQFLLYVVERALADPRAAISELEIGHKVFGRRPDYSTGEDNIVRVEARNLRKKLEAYFATDGKDEATVIVIPKGSYLPRFEPRAQAPVAEAHGDVRAGPPRVRLAITAGAVLALAVTAFLLWPYRSGSGRGVSPTANPLWTRIFDKASRTNIVVGDMCLALVQDSLQTDLSLADYVGRPYLAGLLESVPNRELRATLAKFSGSQCTSFADVIIASRIDSLGRQYGNEVRIRYARHLNIREFKTDNFVLIGSRRAIPWVELLEPRMNFVLERDRQSGQLYFRNKAPRPGEQPLYQPAGDRQRGQETYAVVALLPNTGDRGSVLLLEGITMEGTEAAGEFVTAEAFPVKVQELLVKHGADPRTAFYELLLQTWSEAGSARSSRIVSYRVLEAAR